MGVKRPFISDIHSALKRRSVVHKHMHILLLLLLSYTSAYVAMPTLTHAQKLGRGEERERGKRIPNLNVYQDDDDDAVPDNNSHTR
jgi:hypothetical protein